MEFKKYSRIYRLGHDETTGIFDVAEDEIVIQEKIDGGNTRFLINNGKVIVGSRTQKLTSDEGEDTNMNKNFTRCVNFVRDQLSQTDITPYNGLILYGENCVKHTMQYDWDKIPPFLGFDVYNVGLGEYLPYSEVVKIFSELKLPMVPLVKIVKAKEIKEVNDDMVPVSVYAPRANPKQKAEGVVFKNYRKQLFAKYVRDDFKEKNREQFGGNKKHADDDSEKIVFEYCPNPRIDKCIFKLVDEGHKLDMPMMRHLPEMVYTDMIEENWKEILGRKNDITFNPRKVFKQITKRCKNVLEQVITNNALNEVTK